MVQVKKPADDAKLVAHMEAAIYDLDRQGEPKLSLAVREDKEPDLPAARTTRRAARSRA